MKKLNKFIERLQLQVRLIYRNLQMNDNVLQIMQRFIEREYSDKTSMG